MRSVYLDNNATTRVPPAVLDVMLPFFTEHYANPSSLHGPGTRVGRAVREARSAVQALIGAAHDHEVIFTSGGTESNNTALRAGLAADPARREIVTSTVEHAATLALCDRLERHEGVVVHRVPVDRHGRLDIDAYRSALGPETALVSLMWANNETGTIWPIEGLAELAHQAGALFHTDAVQAVGKVPLCVADTSIDLLSLSGHKLHGPKGVGALYLRRGVRFAPLMRGGRQERGRRAGTENTPAIVGLGKAAELALTTLERDLAQMRELRDRLEHGLLERIADSTMIGDPLDRLANTSMLAFAGIESEAVLMFLDRQGVATSAGSACSSGSLEPSHVLRAMAVPEAYAHSAVRFSLSRETTAAEIDHVLDIMPAITERLRAVSPFWPPGDAAPVAAAF